MISKSSIERFMKNPLEDWSWMKTIPIRDLQKELKHLMPDFQFKTDPYHHQLVSFIVGYYNSSFLFLLDMGAGKTKITLDLLSYKKKYVTDSKKNLIIVPNVVTVNSWATEIVTHSDLTFVELIGTKEERIENLRKDVDLYLINYGGLPVMMAEKVKHGKKGKLEPNPDIYKSFIKKFDAVIWDELHLCKNSQSLVFRLSNIIAKQCKFRYGLTGTPFGRDPIDLWSQFYLIDRGETLGCTISLFRSAFFTEKRNFFGGKDYIFKSHLQKQLQGRLRNRSLRYDENEILDLPPRVYRKITIKLPLENRQYYNNLLRNLISIEGNQQEIENIFVRLRQVSSGFLDFKPDKDVDERITIKFDENPKLEMLGTLISSSPSKSKLLVFNEFILSGDMIAEFLEEEKIGYVRLYSGTKDKRAVLDTFLKDESCKIFLVNSQSGSVALNLQVANYVIFYESPVSPIVRKQAEKRVHRSGQKKRVYIYDLVGYKTIDEKILMYIEQGKDLFNALLTDPKILISDK